MNVRRWLQNMGGAFLAVGTGVACASSTDTGSAGDAAADTGPADATAGDAIAEDAHTPVDAATDAGYPVCSSTQSCVQYGPGGRACLRSCAGADAGDCASGTVCTMTSGCCTGTGCSAIAVRVCCPPSGCSTEGPGPDAGADAAPGDAKAPVDAADDGGFPACSATQSCVQSTSSGRACLPSCSADAGGCASGSVCTLTGGCCVGTGCAAISVHVCCPPSGC